MNKFIISDNIIGREVSRLLGNGGSWVSGLEVGQNKWTVILPGGQTSIGFSFPDSARLLSLDEFSGRYIAPGVALALEAEKVSAQ